MYSSSVTRRNVSKGPQDVDLLLVLHAYNKAQACLCELSEARWSGASFEKLRNFF